MKIDVLIFSLSKNTIKTLKEEVHWHSIGVDAIYTTNNYTEAKDLLEYKKISLILCELCENVKDGIKLMRWLEEKDLDIHLCQVLPGNEETISRPAVKIKTFYEYIFLPLEISIVEEKIQQIVNLISVRESLPLLVKYGRSFLNNRDVYEELFWSDILNEIIPAQMKGITRVARKRKIELTSKEYYIMLLNCNDGDGKWKEWSKCEKMCMIRNLLVKTYDGYLISSVFKDEYNVACILKKYEDFMTDREQIHKRSNRLVELLNQEIGVSFTVYYSKTRITVEGISPKYQSLLKLMKQNVSSKPNVICYEECEENKVFTISKMKCMKWKILLENGNVEDLMECIYTTLNEMDSKYVPKESLIKFRFELWNLLFESLQIKKIDTRKFLTDDKVLQAMSCSVDTITEMKHECYILLHKTRELLSENISDEKTVDLIKKYIVDNICNDISRNTVAEYMQYNADYLSRLFRKETGQTLTDYIQDEKIKVAIVLLTEANQPVSRIADRLGFTNFSYFSQLFKSKTGYSAKHYQKLFLEMMKKDDMTLQS